MKLMISSNSSLMNPFTINCLHLANDSSCKHCISKDVKPKFSILKNISKLSKVVRYVRYVVSKNFAFIFCV